MSDSYVAIFPPPVHRKQDAVSYPIQRLPVKGMNLEWSWGSEPGTCTIDYLPQSGVTVQTGTCVQIADPTGRMFYGVCVDDTELLSTSGNIRRMTFKDNRYWMEWDLVYALFNEQYSITDSQTQQRIRYWRHIYPRDYKAKLYTYTNSPLTAKEMLDLIFDAPTTEDPWSRVYHTTQTIPIPSEFRFDGETLKSAIQRICETQGVLFTIDNGPTSAPIGQRGFSLMFRKKGFLVGGESIPVSAMNTVDAVAVLEGLGAAVTVLTNTDDREFGFSLSQNPTRITVLGDSNVYQVHNIPMIPDWTSGWNNFFSFDIHLLPAIFNNALSQYDVVVDVGFGSDEQLVTIPAGTPYTEFEATSDNNGGDIVAHQMATAHAKSISVRELAALLHDNTFLDARRYSGRSRNDMPAALYIAQIVFRAFRFPDNFVLNTVNGNIPISCLEIADHMCARVTHDPTTGMMSWNPADYENTVFENPDGNGYAITQGYQVGHDLFAGIRPDRVSVAAWQANQKLWQKIEFDVDDSGMFNKTIIFEEPVILSSDYLIQHADGIVLVNEHPTIKIPPVSLTIAFRAEPFAYTVGTGSKDSCERMNGLSGEYCLDYSGQTQWQEMKFANNLTATEIAFNIASAIIIQQMVYLKGNIKRPLFAGDTPTYLNGCLDRISLQYSASGFVEIISYTSERGHNAFVPDRDAERITKYRMLFPHQKELRQQGWWNRESATLLGRDKRIRTELQKQWNEMYGAPNHDPQISTLPISMGVDDILNQPFPAGTVILKIPFKNGDPDSTRFYLSSSVQSEVDIEFVGVVYKANCKFLSDPTNVAICHGGKVAARVRGPVKAGDTIYTAPGSDYLYGPIGSALEFSVAIGIALTVITDATEHLIFVGLGAAPGSLATWQS